MFEITPFKLLPHPPLASDLRKDSPPSAGVQLDISGNIFWKCVSGLFDVYIVENVSMNYLAIQQRLLQKNICLYTCTHVNVKRKTPCSSLAASQVCSIH